MERLKIFFQKMSNYKYAIRCTLEDQFAFLDLFCSVLIACHDEMINGNACLINIIIAQNTLHED